MSPKFQLMRANVFILLFFVSLSLTGQDSTFTEKDISISKWIDGTLLIPINKDKSTLAIIIAGSGPTNRNGNQNFMKNNSLKKLAEGLGQNGIATFRYDKRVVKQIQQSNVDLNTKFDDFVNDAQDVIIYFRENEAFDKIYVLGHSQGSLVGMLSSHENVDGFISIAGAGRNIGDVIVEQVTNMNPDLGAEAQKVVDQLKKGEMTTDFPPVLASVFNTSIQAFMINWMQYNPTDIIKNLKIPLLIINGTKDLQVSVDEAELLKKANNGAELVIIENMNHVLFEIKGDDLENSKSYNEVSRPISPALIENIVSFIKS